jgi:hypothetical protein
MNPQIYDNVHYFNKDGTIGKGIIIKKNKHHYLNVLIDRPETFVTDINSNMIFCSDFSNNSLITFIHLGKIYNGIINYGYLINSFVIELDEPIVTHDEPISIKYRTEIAQNRIIKIIDSFNSLN